MCPLATTMALRFGLSDFELSMKAVKAYDSTWTKVLNTLTLELQIGPIVFFTVFQVLRIPTSFNLLFGKP